MRCFKFDTSLDGAWPLAIHFSAESDHSDSPVLESINFSWRNVRGTATALPEDVATLPDPTLVEVPTVTPGVSVVVKTAMRSAPSLVVTILRRSHLRSSR